MSGGNAEYAMPIWFKAIVIAYVSLVTVCILLFLGLILFGGEDEGGEPIVELGPFSFGLVTTIGGSVMIFTVVGVPVLALVHYGLKNPAKPIKYMLFAAAAAWAIYMTVRMIQGN